MSYIIININKYINKLLSSTSFNRIPIYMR